MTKADVRKVLDLLDEMWDSSEVERDPTKFVIEFTTAVEKLADEE